ncbi:MAG: hypothetical protein ACTHJ1_05160 [Bordetella sp.]|uniref:hypothetical protein n=1 Tax=Bordetella sp. TaxID=28081 RepID=UPI003F7C1A3F
MSTRPHNGWWQASNNAPRRWLDQLKTSPSVDGKLAEPAGIAPATPRLRVRDGRLQQV